MSKLDKAVRYLRIAAVACFALLVTAVFLASGCGGDDKKPGSSSSGECPAELAGNSAEWMHDGDDEQCAELASVLNDGLDVAGDDSGCAGGLDVRMRGGECVATLDADCEDEGIALELDCAVRSSGSADCAAIVRSDELEAGSCSFVLLLR